MSDPLLRDPVTGEPSPCPCCGERPHRFDCPAVDWRDCDECDENVAEFPEDKYPCNGDKIETMKRKRHKRRKGIK